MYKLIYETPQGTFEQTFEVRPNVIQLLNAVGELRDRAQLPALLQPKTEAPCASH